MRLELFIIVVINYAEGSFVGKNREDDEIDFSKIFDEDREKAQLFLAPSATRIRVGKYTKYTKRHKEIVNELAASSSNAGKSNTSMFEDACKIFETEGLAPMPFTTFYAHINRSRDEMKRTGAVNSADFLSRPKNILLDTIISEVFHREERRGDGKKRKLPSSLHSEFVEEAIRRGLGQEAQAMASSTFYTKICRLRERGYL